MPDPQFVDHGAEFYQARHRQREINSLKRKAANLGYQFTGTTAVRKTSVLDAPVFAKKRGSKKECAMH